MQLPRATLFGVCVLLEGMERDAGSFTSQLAVILLKRTRGFPPSQPVVPQFSLSFNVWNISGLWVADYTACKSLTWHTSWKGFQKQLLCVLSSSLDYSLTDVTALHWLSIHRSLGDGTREGVALVPVYSPRETAHMTLSSCKTAFKTISFRNTVDAHSPAVPTRRSVYCETVEKSQFEDTAGCLLLHHSGRDTDPKESWDDAFAQPPCTPCELTFTFLLLLYPLNILLNVSQRNIWSQNV